MDKVASVGKITAAVFDSAEAYRIENEALRKMLQDRGVSSRQIRREVQKTLKQHKVRETALETFARAARAIERILREIDVPQELIESLAEKTKERMN